MGKAREPECKYNKPKQAPNSVQQQMCSLRAASSYIKTFQEGRGRTITYQKSFQKQSTAKNDQGLQTLVPLLPFPLRAPLGSRAAVLEGPA